MYHVVIRHLTDGTQYCGVYRGDTLVLMTRSKSEAESYLKLNTRTISVA